MMTTVDGSMPLNDKSLNLVAIMVHLVLYIVLVKQDKRWHDLPRVVSVVVYQGYKS